MMQRKNDRRAAPPPAEEEDEAMAEEESFTPSPGGRLIRFLVRHDRRVVVVRAADVDWMEAAGNYVILHKGGENHVLRESLLALEQRLDARQFARVSRSAIVNLDRVTMLVPAEDHGFMIVLNDGVRLPLTRGLRYLQERLEQG